MSEITNQYKIEIGRILGKPHYTSRTVKVCIPALTPTLPNTSIYNNNIQLKSTINLVNKKLPITRISIKNYFELPVPAYIMSSFSRNKYGYLTYSPEVIVSFVGNDISNPKIIGIA